MTVNKSDIETWLANDAVAYVAYMINDKNLHADVVVHLPNIIPDTIECLFEEEMTGIEGNMETYIKYKFPELTYQVKNAPIGVNAESPFAFFFRCYLIRLLFGDYRALDHTFVLPPSRGAAMTENVIPVTDLFKKFDKDKMYIESAKEHPVENVSSIMNLMHRVMEGRVDFSENNRYQYIMDGVESEAMPLTAAASSIRELASIQMLIDNIDVSKVAILFEEPEAHLHPAKQRLIADVLSCLSSCGTCMQITTHSDYLCESVVKN